MPWNLNAIPVWDDEGVDFSINDGRSRVVCRISREVLEALHGHALGGGADALRAAFDANLKRIVAAAGKKASSPCMGPETLPIVASDLQ